MSILRSKDLWTSAYFLSRCGNRVVPHDPPEPPAQLHAATWQDAYDSFFESLADGRTLMAFRRTLKNARDLFDGHIDSGRIGWRDSTNERPPQPLGDVPKAILDQWSQRTDNELWEAVRLFVGTIPARMPNQPADATSTRSRRRREQLLDSIERTHILEAINLFNAGYRHEFGESTKFDLIFEGHAYPPKAIVGLANVPLHGEPLKPEDFTGGAGSKCFKILSLHGFQVVPKPSEFRPTAEPQDLERLTREALSAPNLLIPSGQNSPAQVLRSVSVYERDPLVRAYVLKRSAGKCECCGETAPFIDKFGEPFLEVHHIQPLAEKGEDVVGNTAAICPNCHRECHLGQNAPALRRLLLARISEAQNRKN